MKWLGLLALVALAGCHDELLDSPNGKEEGAPKDDHSGNSHSADRKSFSSSPNELKVVLKTLREETGWTLTCEPELEQEIVYLKFKDKTEREVAQALGQVLLANYPQKQGAMSLSAEHAAMINRTMFHNEVYLPRILPPIKALQEAAVKMRFRPGFALEKVRQDVKFLRGLETRNADAERRLQTLTPEARACLDMVQTINEAEFATLKMEEPRIWSTAPTGSELSMTPEMEAALDRFIEQSIEWNSALRAAQARGSLHELLPAPTQFSPRSDFSFRLERGEPQLLSTTKSFSCTLSIKGSQGPDQILRHLLLPIEQFRMKGDAAVDPQFAKDLEELTRGAMFSPEISGTGNVEKSFDSGLPGAGDADLRLKIIRLSLEYSSDKSANIAANLSSRTINSISSHLIRSQRMMPAHAVNPDMILLEDHAKMKAGDWVQYRPYFTVYERIDRPFWKKRGMLDFTPRKAAVRPADAQLIIE